MDGGWASSRKGCIRNHRKGSLMANTGATACHGMNRRLHDFLWIQVVASGLKFCTDCMKNPSRLCSRILEQAFMVEIAADV
jgi:hypothetical protein